MLTDDIISFIEEVMMTYGLEDGLINEDLLLKKKLSEVNSLSERASLKLLFGEKIKDQQKMGKSLEDILPSMKLKRILEKLIDKKISYSDLPNIIKIDLVVDDTIAKKISDSIKNSQKINDAVNNQITNDELIEEEIEEPEEVVGLSNTKKSIGGELLK